MSELLDLLKSSLGKTLIEGTSNQLGMDKKKAGFAIQAALPLILGAMKNNASSKKGADSLLKALGNNRHNGGLLDNLSSVLGGNNIDDNVVKDGEGIIGHVFRGKQNNVAAAVSKSSGINLGQSLNILKVAAPVIMGLLGKKTRASKVSDSGGLGSLLGSMLGGQSKQEAGLINQLLDADGDGSAIDDVAKMLMSSSGKKSGLGGLLGGFLKR